jgi:orotidine-5'-phosphate decarboxylase
MRDNIIIALDTSNVMKALQWIDQFSNRINWYKIGLELWSSGLAIPLINELKLRGKKVFLDVKLHDIPNTVKKASINIAELGVDMFNVHAQGGIPMMQASVNGVKGVNNYTKVIAVTVLTSKEANNTLVRELALEAVEAGLDGWVSSGIGAQMLQQLNHDKKMNKFIVIPGIRPVWSVSKDDQKQIVTPSEAFRNGATHIVVGRAVTANDHPDEALDRIIKETYKR